MSDDEDVDASTYDEASIELSIETLTGTSFEMTVYPTDTVVDIKTKIQRVEGIPVLQQHLLFKLQELRDDDRLCDKGITRGATLRLVLSMRGGPISTRRLQASEHHIAWKEIKEFVETTKENMVDKLPPGSKVTVLLFREGDTINLFRVIENENGTYSPLCDATQKSAKAGKSKWESSTSVFKRFLENSATLNKVSELRRRMGDLSLKRQMKNSQPVVEADADSSRLSDANMPSTSGCIGQRRRDRINRHGAAKSNSEKYSERILAMHARREGHGGKSTVGRSHRAHRVSSSVPAGILISNEQDSDEDISSPTDYASPESIAASVNSPDDKEPLSKTLDKKLRRITNTGGASKVSSNGVQLYVVQDPVERPKTAPQKFEQDASDICDMVLNDQSEICNNGGSVKLGLINRRQSLDCASGVDYNNISHLEYAEANIESQDSSSLLTTTNPDMSTTTSQWSLKCLQMQQCYVSTASAIPPQYAPKDEPVVEEEPDRIYMNVKLPEPLHRQTRFPLYGRKTTTTTTTTTTTARQSNIERIRNDGIETTAGNYKKSYGCCNYGYTANLLDKDVDSGSGIKRRDLCGVSYVENIERVTTSSCLQEFGGHDSQQQPSAKSSIGDNRSAKTSKVCSSSVELLPPIVTKKRIRCGQCNKRLNITNVYDCPCGGVFCSQHRYSEVHGCRYDYKTEGRKLIEKANPLVTACKLPKI